jgi:hypothetical protein
VSCEFKNLRPSSGRRAPQILEPATDCPGEGSGKNEARCLSWLGVRDDFRNYFVTAA